MRIAALLAIAVSGGLALSGADPPCQVPREMRLAAVNLSFSEGTPGDAPPGWFLGPEWFMPPHAPVYEAKLAGRELCHGSPQCATVDSLREDPSVRLSFLYQVIDATQHRGEKVTLRADVRADATRRSVARLLVRVHTSDCGTSFRDDMGSHPITSGTWAPYEIQAPVSLEARDIEFGLQLIGPGAAWIDNVSMTFGGRQ